ncbi:MAG: hypothetical protein LBT30_04925 [Clostridiales bacterium]|jgi:uncharacterized Zn finger protein (UPF0148 family)|nr:hypothetical protein [Clostridiales bacterium]
MGKDLSEEVSMRDFEIDCGSLFDLPCLVCGCQMIYLEGGRLYCPECEYSEEIF